MEIQAGDGDMNSRRQILKLLGIAPAAGMTAATELATTLASPSAKAAMSLVGVTAQSAGHPLDAPSRLGEILHRQIQRLRNRAESEQYVFQASRHAGLDPDIDALRSVSRVNKVRRQRERDCEGIDIIKKAEEALWG